MSKDLKSEAFVGFFFPAASASATTGAARTNCNLSTGVGLTLREDAELHLKQLCELARDCGAAPIIAPREFATTSDLLFFEFLFCEV